LELEEVSKQYLPPPPLLRPLIRVAAKHPVDALRDVSFTVDRGEVVGLVGPNGAGKTTLIRIISTLLEPGSGRAVVDGFDVMRHPEEVRRRLGLVLEADRGLYKRLTGKQNLEFFGIHAGLRREAARSRAEELLDRFGLADQDKLLFGYSSGMKVRLSLARALAADAPLLVLDEPTRSLDPLASFEVGQMLRELADRGHAILLSDHRLEELVSICDRVVVLVNGRVVYQGSPTELESDRGGQAVAALRELMRDGDD
ncbi:MAG: ABC transporter ATP-binding protein, partial [Acidimicrobiia bacterium]